MLIGMQKINFISHFFLKILQRNNKLVILGNLGMPGHIHLKWQYQSEETFDVSLDSFQEKLMKIFFKESKKPFWGCLGHFLPKFGKKYIFLERMLYQFLNIRII